MGRSPCQMANVVRNVVLKSVCTLQLVFMIDVRIKAPCPVGVKNACPLKFVLSKNVKVRNMRCFPLIILR